ncbi:hypothetical protein KGQ31_01065 [Patescibacteria group bacterium]|nr:hypothetical protein [Patescibacteria group bacterium]
MKRHALNAFGSISPTVNLTVVEPISAARRATPQCTAGFTLIEALVSIAVFVLLTATVAATASAIIRATASIRESTTVAALADRYLEIARNLPYSQVGTVSGNPYGVLPDLPDAVSTTTPSGEIYQIYYAVSYVDDPADGTITAGTDSTPNDYKQVKLYVKNTATGQSQDFYTTIAPKNLEDMASGGALAIKVFDSVGQPVPGATITITDTAIQPALNVVRTSDSSGNWLEVGLPASPQSYHIVVTKNGYSSDQTYPISQTNPNPVKPDATVASGQVTAVSFSIDKTSSLTLNTLSQTCGGIPGVGVEVKGTKLIGTPDVLKFDQTYTSNNIGQIILSPVEWDTYTPLLLSGSGYMIYGSSPIQEVNLLPATAQQFTFVLGPQSANALLVIVKDAASGNAIEGAAVDLQKASPASDTVKITDGSVWSQADWSGGSGQSDWSDPTKYLADSGTISTGGTPSGVRLAGYGNGTFASSGTLTSSSFDTGTASTQYTTLTWQPTSQDPAATLEFQIATNNDDATWNFVGPDGTPNSYFTVPGTTINSAQSDNRYIRYKAYLQTSDPTKTPVLTSVTANYVSGCKTPGQAMFPNLAGGNDYTLSVSMSGYQTATLTPLTVSGYNTLTVSLGP